MIETVSLQAYLKELDALLDDESPTEVVSHCRYILQHFPKNVAAYRMLGKALLQKGQNESQPALVEEAAEIFRRVLSACPDDFVAHLGLGEAAQFQGRLDEAVWYYERAAEQAPENAALRDAIRQLDAKRGAPLPEARRSPSRAALVRQYLKAGNTDQALAEVRAVLADSSDRLDLRVLEAEALWHSGRWGEAGEAAAAILRDHPDCLAANRILAELWLMYKRPADAQPFLSRLEALDPLAAARVVGGPDASAEGVTLARLDYTAKAAASLTAETPDWVQELGEGDEFQEQFTAPMEAGGVVPGPPTRDEAPIGEVPDWAAVFAGAMEDLPADAAGPDEDEGPALALGIDWSIPAGVEEPPAEGPITPGWYDAPVEPSPFDAGGNVPGSEWVAGLAPSGLEPFEVEPLEAQAPAEEVPSDFESFLQDVSARQMGGTGALDEGGLGSDQPATGRGDAPAWGEEPGDEPAEETGYALDWMADLDAPEALDAGGDSVAAAPDAAQAEWDAEHDQPTTEDEWLSRLDAELTGAVQGDEDSEADDAWLLTLETRAGPASLDEAVPDEEAGLSDEDWLARLTPGGRDADATDEPDRVIAEELVGDKQWPSFEATLEEDILGADQPAPAEPDRAGVTEDELEALRRASMPPPDMDLNELLGIGREEADAEAEPGEIPAWLQGLAPDVGDPASTEMPQPGLAAWSTPEREGAALDEPADRDGAVHPDALAQDIAWVTDDAVREATAAEADLLADLGQPAALSGDTEQDAGLPAFLAPADEPETPGDAREPSHTAPLPGEDDEITTDELRWLEEQQPGGDWLGSYSKDVTEAQAGPESWLPAEEAATGPELAPEATFEDEAALPSTELNGAGHAVTESEAADQPGAAWIPPTEGWLADEGAATAPEPVREAQSEDADALSFLELIEAGQAVTEPEAADQPGAAWTPPSGDWLFDEEAAAEPILEAPDQGAAPVEPGTLPAWLAEMQPAQDLSPLAEEFEALLDEGYDPFEGGRADQVPTYAAAKETGILQPDEQPEWMTAFLDDAADEPAPEQAPAGGFPAVGGAPGPKAQDEAGAVASLAAEEAAGLPHDAEAPVGRGLSDWITLDEEPEVVQPPVDVAPTEAPDAAPVEEGPARSIYTPLAPREPQPAHMPDWLAAIASESDVDMAELPGVEETHAGSSVEAAPGDLKAWPNDEMAAYESVEEADEEDLAFLQQLDVVDWLPDAQGEPTTDEIALKDDLLNDLDLSDLGEAFAPPPIPEVAQPSDLADTTSAPAELPPVVDEIPAEAFAFDDELPAWLKRSRDQSGAASGGTSPSASSLPEWLRAPEQDPD